LGYHQSEVIVSTTKSSEAEDYNNNSNKYIGFLISSHHALRFRTKNSNTVVTIVRGAVITAVKNSCTNNNSSNVKKLPGIEEIIYLRE
jgi:hypothetical protein